MGSRNEALRTVILFPTTTISDTRIKTYPLAEQSINFLPTTIPTKFNNLLLSLQIIVVSFAPAAFFLDSTYYYTQNTLQVCFRQLKCGSMSPAYVAAIVIDMSCNINYRARLLGLIKYDVSYFRSTGVPYFRSNGRGGYSGSIFSPTVLGSSSSFQPNN